MADIETTKAMIDDDTMVVNGRTYRVTNANIARYAAAKRTAQAAVLANFQKSRGIVVKGEVKK